MRFEDVGQVFYLSADGKNKISPTKEAVCFKRHSFVIISRPLSERYQLVWLHLIFHAKENDPSPTHLKHTHWLIRNGWKQAVRFPHPVGSTGVFVMIWVPVAHFIYGPVVQGKPFM